MMDMLQLLTTLDTQILLWMQQSLRFASATAFWELMTDLGNAGFLWIVTALVLLARRKTRTYGIAVILALFLDVVITNGILKLLIARPRPFLTHADIIPLIKPPGGFSFPSGHSASSFAVSFVLYKLLPKRVGIPAVVLAVLIGFSRMYLGVHYPSDVLAGLVVGYGIARFVVWVLPKLRLPSWLMASRFRME